MQVREVARGGVHEGDHRLQVLVPAELLREGPHTLEGIGAEVAIMKDRQAVSCLNQLCLEVREPVDRLQSQEPALGEKNVSLAHAYPSCRIYGIGLPAAQLDHRRVRT